MCEDRYACRWQVTASTSRPRDLWRWGCGCAMVHCMICIRQMRRTRDDWPALRGNLAALTAAPGRCRPSVEWYDSMTGAESKATGGRESWRHVTSHNGTVLSCKASNDRENVKRTFQQYDKSCRRSLESEKARWCKWKAEQRKDDQTRFSGHLAP
jgi:hypothetical protein